MDIRRLFRSYKYKLLGEGILKSLLWALLASGISVFATSLVYHILVKRTPAVLTAVIGGAAFLLVFCFVLGVFYYPTKKRVARRMDAMGLQERVGTMLEYQNESGVMVQLQREDALLHIEKSSPKQLKMRSFWKEGLLCTLGLCMAFTVLMLPHDIFKITAEKEIVTMDETQSQIIKDLIENMREEIKNSLLDEELKEEIEEIIDKLEQDLNSTDSKLEQAGKIEDAKEQIKDLLEKEMTRNSIGKQLQMYQLTKPLGVAVSNGDLEGVSKELEELRNRLEEDIFLVENLYGIIDRVLVDSEVEETDELYGAFFDFSEELKTLDTKSESFAEDLRSVFERAEEAILNALEQQEMIESEKEKLEDILNDAKEEILEDKNGEEEEKGDGEEGKGDEEGQDGEQPGEQPGEKPGDKPGDKPGEQPGDKPGDKPGDQPGEGDEIGGSGDGIGGDDVDKMTEGLYDPISGSVSYGKVFASYYADYLAARKEGKIPEALLPILDAYFAQLTNPKE